MAKENKETTLKLNLDLAGLNVPTSNPSGSRSADAGQTSPALVIDLNVLLKFIKPYNGDRDTLNPFLVNCQNALDMASAAQRPILFKYILSQLEGKAETACAIKEFTSFDQLKEFLKTQFCIRKHYSHLLTELQDCRQAPQENVSQYSLRVETCLSQLLTEISLSETKKTELPGRLAAMKDLALHHFLMGLLPRISTIVRCRAPKNLNEAINLAVFEEKIQNSQFAKRNINHPNSNSSRPNYNFNNNQNRPNTKVLQNNTVKSPRSTSFSPNNPNTSTSPFCRYCKKLGHDIKDCELRVANNNRRLNQKPFNPNQFSRVTYVDENTHYDDSGEDVVDQPDDSLNE